MDGVLEYLQRKRPLPGLKTKAPAPHPESRPRIKADQFSRGLYINSGLQGVGRVAFPEARRGKLPTGLQHAPARSPHPPTPRPT